MADTENSTITVVMSKDRLITVNFTAPGGLYTVTVEASPAAGGLVTIETPCGSVTSDNVQPAISTECLPGSGLTLKAEPAEGYRFRGWRGDLRDSHDNVTLTVDSSKAIAAKFAKPSQFHWWSWATLGIGALLAATAVVARLMQRRGKGKDKARAGGEVR